MATGRHRMTGCQTTRERLLPGTCRDKGGCMHKCFFFFHFETVSASCLTAGTDSDSPLDPEQGTNGCAAEAVIYPRHGNRWASSGRCNCMFGRTSICCCRDHMFTCQDVKRTCCSCQGSCNADFRSAAAEAARISLFKSTN